MLSNHKKWVKNVFDKAAPMYGEEEGSFFDYFGRKLVEIVPIEAGKKALDIACGKGAVLFPLMEKIQFQGSVIGIDFSHKMVSEVQKRISSKNNVKIMQMDAERLKFDDESFDYILSGFAIFFFPLLSNALKEAFRVLKKDGYFAVSIWNGMPNLTSWVMEQAKQLGVKGSLAASPIKDALSLHKLLEDAGFKNITVTEESKTFWYESFDAWWNSLWTHGTRARLEKLSPAELNTLRGQVLNQAKKVQDEKGIPEKYCAYFAIGQKS